MKMVFYHLRRGLRDFDSIFRHPIHFFDYYSNWYNVEKKIALETSRSYRLYKFEIDSDYYTGHFTGDGSKVLKLTEDNITFFQHFPIVKTYVSARNKSYNFNNFTNLSVCHEYLLENYRGIDATALNQPVYNFDIYNEGFIWNVKDLKLNFKLLEKGKLVGEQLELECFPDNR